MMVRLKTTVITLFISAIIIGCENKQDPGPDTTTILAVLGIAQDAGYPQAQCNKSCCVSVWDHPEKHRLAACLALVRPKDHKYWLFDATPDFKEQTRWIESRWEVELAGVFLTHAHVGHYTGLIHLGREIVGASKIPVYAMSRMKLFLESNGPWDQLVRLGNIELRLLHSDSAIQITPEIFVTPFLVPHRDEYSETVGYKLSGRQRTAIFIPDIDKWEKWERNLAEEISKVDLAFLDGSFYKNGELPDRDMSTIPHPFVVESMALLNGLTVVEKSKVHFIHLNHTNPLLQEHSAALDSVIVQGFQVAVEGTLFNF